jgi:hypothetical protein
MDYINHVTLTTGDLKKSYRREMEIDLDAFYEKIKNAINKKEPIDYIDGTKLSITKTKNEYVATIFYIKEGTLCPIFTTGGTNSDNSNLWDSLIETKVSRISNVKKPNAPYIVDRIDISLRETLKIFRWTGGFASALGWLFLSNEVPNL